MNLTEKQFIVRVSKKMHLDVKRYSRKQDISMAQVIRKAIDLLLK